LRFERRDWKNEDDLESIIPKSCGVWVLAVVGGTIIYVVLMVIFRAFSHKEYLALKNIFVE